MHRDLHDVVAASIQFGDSILALRAFQHSVAFHVPGNQVSLTFKDHHLTPLSICQCLWSASSVRSFNPHHDSKSESGMHGVCDAAVTISSAQEVKLE